MLRAIYQSNILKVVSRSHSPNGYGIPTALHRAIHTEQVEDFGDYSVILPPEPFVFGVSHIRPRVVPQHIKKPSYADIPGGEAPREVPNRNSGKIALGGEAELRVREAARLASKVREFASTQVQVRNPIFAYSLSSHLFRLASLQTQLTWQSTTLYSAILHIPLLCSTQDFLGRVVRGEFLISSALDDK